MNQEFLSKVANEGYEVIERNGEFLLVDLVGKFIDSRHNNQQSLLEYCQQNVLTF